MAARSPKQSFGAPPREGHVSSSGGNADQREAPSPTSSVDLTYLANEEHTVIDPSLTQLAHALQHAADAARVASSASPASTAQLLSPATLPSTSLSAAASPPVPSDLSFAPPLPPSRTSSAGPQRTSHAGPISPVTSGTSRTEKAAVRKERNRLAAQKSRDKKQAQQSRLEEELADVRAENETLKEAVKGVDEIVKENEVLRAKVRTLEAVLLAAGVGQK
ncbi:hypothetical protein JCM11641_004416 [Rhodosporidiobolus odoratus]